MFTRPILIGLAVLALLGLVLWGAWVFDPSSAEERAAKGGATETEFSYALPEDRESGDILIGCSEDHLDEPTDAFVKWLKLQGIPLELPGGPMAIARLNDVAMSEQLQPAQRTAIEILKRYSPRRVVLVVHTFCIYYDAIAAWNDTLPKVRERQVQDLEAAEKTLREWFPRAQISSYIAEEENRKLFFRSVR